MTDSAPQFIVRNDDFEIFSLNPDLKTYSNYTLKETFPDNLLQLYPVESFDRNKFFHFIGSYEELVRVINVYKEHQNRQESDLSDYTNMSNILSRITDLENKIKDLERAATVWRVDTSSFKQVNERE